VSEPLYGTKPDCLFCQIVAGTAPARRLAESARSLAFFDIAPVAPTHVLVVPKVHRRDVAELHEGDGELLIDLFALANRCAHEQGIAESGYRLVFNVGDDAGNSVPHLHLHVLGGRRFAWPPG
jgi:histidine triad (HIT) family protein